MKSQKWTSIDDLWIGQSVYLCIYSLTFLISATDVLMHIEFLLAQMHVPFCFGDLEKLSKSEVQKQSKQTSIRSVVFCTVIT